MSKPSTSPPPPPSRPGIGVGVFVTRRTQTPTGAPTTSFILGLRQGSHGAGTWALPGGHLELNESFETCAAREIMEETGLSVSNIRFLTATNDIMVDEAKHYVTVFVVAEVEGGGEPEVLEPEKCEGWEWVGWEELVRWVETGERRLFLPLVNLVKTRPGVVPGI